MPGKVVRIEVSNGDSVEEGEALVVLEAMKMEHTIRAPYRGTIEAVRFSDGDQVEADAVLVVVRPD
jgi:3-methylcrotonyl-CoA carboxylase alpha subunit